MIRSYCTCGWSDLDDAHDSTFNGHVFGDLSSNHRMCSFGEWKLCKEIFHKDIIINKLESKLEENCSEEVIILKENVMLLEKQVEMLKEKLYANTNDGHCERGTEASGGTERTEQTRSRLSRRRKTASG